MSARILSSIIPLDESIQTDTSIAQFILYHLKKYYDKEIFLDCPTGRVWSGRQIENQALKLATIFVEKFGIKSGDVVLISAPNSDYYAITLISVFICGAIFIGIADNCTHLELLNAVNDLEVSYIIGCEKNLENVAKVFHESNKVKKLFIIDSETQAINDFESLLKWFDYDIDINVELPVMRCGSDTATFLLTSGSSGKPKAAVRTNSNLIHLALSLKNKQLFGDKSGDIAMTTLFMHLSGMSLFLHFMSEGSKIAIMREKLDVLNFCQYAQKYGITTTIMVPTFIYLLANRNIVDNFDLSSVRKVMTSGASLSPNKRKIIDELLPNMEIKCLYAMTETGLISAVTELDLQSAPLASVGKAIPGCLIKIVDQSSGQQLPAYQTGEICVKSGQVCAGYYKLPDISAQSFDSDGFFKTGDAGYYDDNDYLFIVGRYKEIIKVSGSVVSLVELEDILCAHEAIKEVSVISVADDIKGEIPKAFIVLKDGYSDVNEQSIHSYLLERVNPVKQLWGGIVFLTQLPKLPFGKVNKNALKLL